MVMVVALGGGDGLAFMRETFLLMSDYQKYLFQLSF